MKRLPLVSKLLKLIEFVYNDEHLSGAAGLLVKNKIREELKEIGVKFVVTRSEYGEMLHIEE